MKRLAIILLIHLCYVSIKAQALQKEICVRFRVASSVIELGYGGNEESLAEIVNLLKEVESNPDMELTEVQFCGSASPEGGFQLNRRLANNRRTNVERYIRQRVNLPDSLITRCESSEMWNKLSFYVEQSDMPRKNEVLHQIRETPEFTYNKRGVLVDSRKKRLMDMNYGRTWNYMLREFFPSVRNATVMTVYFKQKEKPQPEPAVETKDPTPTVEPTDTVPQQVDVSPISEKRNAYFAVKTNLLYDALAVPNIGVEFSLGKRWSVAADWMYAWWSKNSKHRYWRIYGGGLSARKWFGKASEVKPLQGHHIGLNAQMFTYDFEFGGKGYMAGEPGSNMWERMNYSIAAEYGYSMPIARRLNLDFSIAAGYMGGRYYKYIPLDNHYVWQTTKDRNWWGPTKLEISLVWLLGHGNYNVMQKGGEK